MSNQRRELLRNSRTKTRVDVTVAVEVMGALRQLVVGLHGIVIWDAARDARRCIVPLPKQWVGNV